MTEAKLVPVEVIERAVTMAKAIMKAEPLYGCVGYHGDEQISGHVEEASDLACLVLDELSDAVPAPNMTTAAPVREEGGAVLEDALDAWIVEGIKKADQRLAEIDPAGCCGMTSEDVQSGRVAAYQKGFQNGVKSTLTDASFVIMNAALATREEAPAEAGSLIQELSDAARWRRMPGNENHHATAALFERAVSALRNQPQAREEAQPVWVDGLPSKHHAKEWFIAETTFGDRVVLTALPEEYTYDFKTADETYIKADRIKRWMPFPDSQYLFPTPPAPEAEKLRAAVEAFMPTNIDLSNASIRDDLVLPIDVTVGELRAISKALTAAPVREEDPAEAGFAVRLQDCLDAAGEARVSVDTGDLRSALSALRAQPPAREEAQPVWVAGVPTKHHAKEWFIAETTFGDRVVLTALPEEYAYDFKTYDETYIKADRIKRWMPFPDSQYLFPHPAPKVDVAEKALEQLVAECLASDFNEHWDSYKEAIQALAQIKGGA